jgi:hypothetical protein
VKRSAFARKLSPRPERVDRSDEFASFKARPVAAVMATRLDLDAPVTIEKESHFYSEPWRRAVADLDCVLCGRHGLTQAAHRNEGKAGGKKLMDDCWTAALCTECHSGIDQGNEFSRDERRQRIDLAILLTVRQLARIGKLRIA